ncbi:DEAD/DEAH box helicase [Sphingobacterium corticibacterium]|uniref:DEAD-box ATP-dependent RNA helicase RhpA n=1 Tax=Sphingobacterium corticibacterium TaxID=2484746 RepID=A0A4V2DCG1_9SPHI|nr:DEAD/DEAH box helicase [Sphingobacterium corticibacterium]RZF61368.1 DEAD/DEAH box helicase [Sphingobacterium corticibacterium]
MSFNNLGIIDPIIKAVNNIGYSTATQIQKQVIPLILKGQDIIGCAQTGTGKTAAFALPVLQLLSSDSRKYKTPRALVLVPTRELAIQIDQSVAQYSKYIQVNRLAIYGGVSQVAQVERLRKGVDMLVATPGRLMDLINQGHVNLTQIKVLILDEADSMLDMGFVHDIKRILKHIPQKRQTLFFSATMPNEIRKFANTILHQPAEINVSPVSSTAEKIVQSVSFVEKKDKAAFLANVLRSNDVKQTLIFTRTKHGADRLVRILGKGGIAAASIHGNKSQTARQKALSSFKNGNVHILIATDIAARGIDIQELPFVINYDLPVDSETYVHRIGRTGRAGKEGKALSLCSEEEKPTLLKIQKLIGFQLPIAKEKNNNLSINN